MLVKSAPKTSRTLGDTA